MCSTEHFLLVYLYLYTDPLNVQVNMHLYYIFIPRRDKQTKKNINYASMLIWFFTYIHQLGANLIVSLSKRETFDTNLVA